MLTLLKQTAGNASLCNEISYNTLNQANFDISTEMHCFSEEPREIRPIQEKPPAFILGELLKAGYDKLTSFAKNIYTSLSNLYHAPILPSAYADNTDNSFTTLNECDSSISENIVNAENNAEYSEQDTEYTEENTEPAKKNKKCDNVEQLLRNSKSSIKIKSEILNECFLEAARNENTDFLILLYDKVENLDKINLDVFEEGLKLALENNNKLNGVRSMLAYDMLYDKFKEGPKDGYVKSNRIFRIMDHFFKRLEKDKALSKENNINSNEYELLTSNDIGSMMMRCEFFDVKIRRYLDALSSMSIRSNYPHPPMPLDNFALALSKYRHKFNYDIVDVSLYAMVEKNFDESNRLKTTFEMLLTLSKQHKSKLEHIEQIYDHAKRADNGLAQYLILKEYCRSVPRDYQAFCHRDKQNKLNCDHKAANSCILYLKKTRDERNKLERTRKEKNTLEWRKEHNNKRKNTLYDFPFKF